MQEAEGTTRHYGAAKPQGTRLPRGSWGNGHETVNPVAAAAWEKGVAESQARHACAC